MRLLQRRPDGTLKLTAEITDDIPPYAILSHTWGADEDEVTFADITNGAGHHKVGNQKIQYCGRQAALHGLEYFWVDTCCIDKSDITELSTAINSMFQWYKSATRCYVYLSDVNNSGSGLRKSRWFTRGWTLQELVAPMSIEFFSSGWHRLGDKQSLEAEIRQITGISVEVLRGRRLSDVSVVERMSWLTKRQTKLPEDMAYCVLGIFDVYMPFNYGERENAFRRLQEEIDKKGKVGTELPLQLENYTQGVCSSNVETSPRPLAMIPFSRDADFVERGAILDQICQRHTKPDSWTALVGLGGVGKSQIAIEYAYRTQDRSPDTWVFWVHASNAARYEQSFRDIANCVEISGRKDKNADIFQLVHDWLHARKRKWILILDNVDDASFLLDTPSTGQNRQANAINDRASRPLKSYLPHCTNGFVLITSRSSDVARKLVEGSAIIAVGPMAKEDAVALIRKKLSPQEDDGSFDELATALEFMPLAIVQATSYISHRASRCSVRQYLKLFQTNDRKKESLLNREGGELQRDPEAKNSIIDTWQISFNHIRQTRPSAADLLSLMSFFDRQGIHESLLRTIPECREQSDDGSDGKSNNQNESNDDDITSRSSLAEVFEDDIVTLRDYSFIYLGEDPTSFTMHNLVQLATRKWLRENGHHERFQQQFLRNLNKELPNGEYENWLTCQLLFPHVKMAASHKPERDLDDWASVLYKAAWYSWRIGNGIEAEEMAFQAMKERKRLWGIGHEDTLDAMALVGLVLKFRGRWNAAEKLEVQVMEMSKTKLGADHPVTLRSMANLASTYQDQGRWDAAEELGVQVMETRKTKLGADHPDTLSSMANLASTYRDQGRWDAAEELGVQVMETHKTKVRADHPDTLRSMTNLASTYWNQGRWGAAEELEVQVMEMSKMKLGADHPDTLRSMNNLASTWKDLGKGNKPLRLMAECISLRQRIIGVSHPFTLTSISTLTRWESEEATALEANKILESILRGYNKFMVRTAVNKPTTRRHSV
ncbi:hypothetical protein BKA67DRAFT_622504 [Truncatella angustata]|uniref:HET-domain-containing protein n=1 Tax=Truncatella angustata TaxID=152316 RepID=A0A9P9A0K7_9PEZI|nr:uncharacterized protein BKA67DRAFT_622504 [Truncatella angustata]KAH6656094.1 hypothetical protein BKA67DRAFT_622504 [Truncatella angustata]